MLEFRILSPLEVVDDDAPLRLGGPKERATLAILLLNANRVVSIDRLADDLYAGAPPATAVTQVQLQISELRKTVPIAPSPIGDPTRKPATTVPVRTGEGIAPLSLAGSHPDLKVLSHARDRLADPAGAMGSRSRREHNGPGATG
jgi:hypothetical protein